MKILIGCEFSGVVRDAFKAQGHDAWSCDLLPTERPGQHIMDDVRNVLDWDWELGIFHPPCTYLTNSGVRWLHSDPDRWTKLDQAAEFFKALWNAPIPHIAIENPIMHKHASKRIGIRRSQTIQPWWFGHGETKATCLWLKNLPALKATRYVKGREQRVHSLPPSETRWMERSRTYEGIAAAFAAQWGQGGLSVQILLPFTESRIAA